MGYTFRESTGQCSDPLHRKKSFGTIRSNASSPDQETAIDPDRNRETFRSFRQEGERDTVQGRLQKREGKTYEPLKMGEAYLTLRGCNE